jgi:hypothetical protein
MEELLEILPALEGMAVHQTILHDDKCTPSSCTCSPHYIIENLTAETWIEGERRQQEWIKKVSS